MVNYEYFSSLSKNASIAQLVEQRFCKPSVVGSTPATGSEIDLLIEFGEIPKRPTGADCNSADLCLRRFESYSPHLIFYDNKRA